MKIKKYSYFLTQASLYNQGKIRLKIVERPHHMQIIYLDFLYETCSVEIGKLLEKKQFNGTHLFRNIFLCLILYNIIYNTKYQMTEI